MVEYQIENVFTTLPSRNGWQQKDGSSFNWDALEKIGGQLGADANARYLKYLPKDLIQTDPLIASFTVMVDDVVVDSSGVCFGFFNSSEPGLLKSVFGMMVSNLTGASHPSLYLAYMDGTIILGSGAYTFNQGDKYVCVIRYVPEDLKAYLEVYDFLTQALLYSENINIDETKTFIMQQVGMSEVLLHAPPLDAVGWMYEVKAVAEPEAVVYADLYSTPEEIRSLTNLDAVKDMSDAQLVVLERIFAIPQVNARFRAEGYSAPFTAGDETPPLVRSITGLLSAAYAARKSYIGHAPSESPAYKAYLDEVNALWKGILNGEYELIDHHGNRIERNEATSTDMLSTTEGQYTLFTLDDLPDITTVLPGGIYVGRDGS